MARICAVHGATESVAACGSCAAQMCDRCFRFVVDRAPICVRCAHERATRAQRRVSLGIFTTLASIGLAAMLGLRFSDDEWVPIAAALGALLGVGGGVLLAIAGRKWARDQPPVQRREDVAFASFLPAAHARVARVRRVVAALSPTISGQTTAVAAFTAMSFTIVSFPVLLRLPRWLEVEFVLALWWVFGTLALYALLVRGYHVEDDHFFQAPHMPQGIDGIGDPSGCDPGCNVGCDDVLVAVAVALVALLVVACSFLMAWLLVELVLPLVFLAFYSTVLLALRRAARDRHDCRGHPLTSLRWALTWSSVYFAPIAALVWALHRILPGLG